MEDLSIGSRVKNEEWGLGVVVQVTTDGYVITFVNHGVKETAKLYAGEEPEVLEIAAPIKDLVSLAAVGTSLRKIVG